MSSMTRGVIASGRLPSALMALMFLCGCASVGKKFDYQHTSGLRIGSTTITEAKDLFGKPRKSTTVSNADGTFFHMQYMYAYADLTGASARMLILEFRKEVLNGFVYSSGFADDSTEFSLTQAQRIQRGVSTKDDALDILGAPSGKVLCPSALGDFSNRCKKGVEAWSWLSTPKSKGLDVSTIKSKSVFVVFGTDGLVSDIETSVEH